MERRFVLEEHERHRIGRALGEWLGTRQEIIFAYLFGSFALDPSFRDVDVGVYVRGVGPEEAFRYGLSLEAALERDFPFPIDVTVLNYAPVPLCHSASDGKLLFSRDEGLRLAWVERTWDLYLDMVYFLRRSLWDLLSAAPAVEEPPA
ncbi:MAG: nucleotidyltransferase domain-containing protein [Firmicutes bacterium]|nr:nucleotidyltransferase domain-containing protein [Bacillota bacterium]